MLPLLQSTPPANNILGIGPGLFIIILLSVAGLVTCFLGSRTSKKAIIIPATVLGLGVIFASLLLTPRADLSSIDTNAVYDYSIAYRILFLVLMIVGVIVGFVGILTTHINIPVYNTPIPDVSAWRRVR